MEEECALLETAAFATAGSAFYRTHEKQGSASYFLPQTTLSPMLKVYGP